MVHARLTVTCDICERGDMLEYSIEPEGHDVDGQLLPAIFIHCRNCGTLHDLADNATERATRLSTRETPS